MKETKKEKERKRKRERSFITLPLNKNLCSNFTPSTTLSSKALILPSLRKDISISDNLPMPVDD